MTQSNEVHCADHPYSGAEFVPTPELTHYGKMVCPVCSKWLAWVKKPDGDKRVRRESQKLAKIFDAHGVDYCQACLRCRNELPANVTLIVHHVIEVQDGGPDEPGNTWRLCTICHEMIHLMRRNRVDPQNRPRIAA